MNSIPIIKARAKRGIRGRNMEQKSGKKGLVAHARLHRHKDWPERGIVHDEREATNSGKRQKIRAPGVHSSALHNLLILESQLAVKPICKFAGEVQNHRFFISASNALSPYPLGMLRAISQFCSVRMEIPR